MKITVERCDWTQHEPDLVVLVGDPYQDFLGPLDSALQARVTDFAEGFASGALSREIAFAVAHQGRLLDCVYFHTSMEKGFTPIENLKTFLARALRLAAETGRKKVAMLLQGPDGEGLVEQLVEGALIGTFRFTEFLKDPTDRCAQLQLVLCLPAPPTVPAEAAEPPSVRADLQVAAAGATEFLDVSLMETEEVGAAADPAESEEATAASEDPVSVEPSAEGEESGEPSGATPAEGAPGPAEDGSETAETDSAEAAPGEAAPEESLGQEAEPEPASVEPGAIEDASPRWDEEALAALQVQDASAVQVGLAFAHGVNLARALIARPASHCTPTHLAETAKGIAKKYGFGFQAFGLKELEKQGFVGHVAVGGGSANPPKMFEMTYQPAEPSSVHLVLLGKGVTFDSGGLSIKPADKMHLMVGDMSGAAAVLGAMDILGQLRPSIQVTAVVVSAENAPDGKSFRPGDILKYKNGLSVHVENTDAEGRLLLADGLIRAGELGATHIVDIATLTGSCARALGPSFTGVMGANRKLINAITRAGGNHGESYWRLPLPVEYRSMLKTVHADLNNVGGAEAGATTAGLFLQEFVPARTVWAHLDIAGTFWKSKPWKYYQEGPSGTGVKTLADLALRWHQHMGS